MNVFQGSERSTLPPSQVTTSIHNGQPITIREGLIDLDVATTRNRKIILGKPSGVLTMKKVIDGTGFEANTTYSVTGGSAFGFGLRIRVQTVDDEGKILEYTIVDAGTEYTINDLIVIGNTTFLVESTIEDSLRTTDALENLGCEVVGDGTDVRNAVRALDDELRFIRQAMGFDAASTTNMGQFDPVTQRFLPDNVNLRNALQTLATGLDNPAVSSIKVDGLAVLDGEIKVQTDDPILLKPQSPAQTPSLWMGTSRFKMVPKPCLVPHFSRTRLRAPAWHPLGPCTSKALEAEASSSGSPRRTPPSNWRETPA